MAGGKTWGILASYTQLEPYIEKAALANMPEVEGKTAIEITLYEKAS